MALKATPIHRLNFDDLYKIFNLAIYESSQSSTPLLLSGVCRSWREVARTSAAMWTDLNIVLSGSLEDHHMLTILDLTKDWLKLSGKCLLHVKVSFKKGSIVEEEFHTNANLPVLKEFGLLLSKYQHKLKSISIPLSEETSWLLKSSLPGLMAVIFNDVNQTAIKPTDIFQFPVLSKLQLHGDRDVSGQLKYMVPQWGDLTELLWDVPIRPVCVRLILSQCSSAIEVKFNQVYIDEIGTAHLSDYVPVGSASFAEVCLPDLRKLEIVYHEGTQAREYLSSLEGLLNAFTMPALEELSIDTGYFALIPFKALGEFSDRSCCSVRKVSLTGISKQRLTGGTEEDLNMCLKTLGNVEDLSIGACAGFKIDVFWKELKENPCAMLPRMRSLHVRGASRPSYDNLVYILQSRQTVSPSSNALAEIKLIIDPSLSKKRGKHRGEFEVEEETLLLNNDREIVSRTLTSSEDVTVGKVGKGCDESDEAECVALDSVSEKSWEWLCRFAVHSWMNLQSFSQWLPT